MTDEMVRLAAVAAGLGAALRDFPEDVRAAAESAGRAAAGLVAPAGPGAEPWPPMRMKP